MWLNESSIVTVCSPVACRSRSDRPRHGRIQLSVPGVRWLLLSFVEMWTVIGSLAQASFIRP